MTAYSLEIKATHHWSQGFVRMFPEKDFISLSERCVRAVCRKMYVNRLQGAFPKVIDNLDEKIENVLRKFHFISKTPDITSKLEILKEDFFQELSDVKGCDLEEADKLDLLSEYHPKMLRVVSGDYLMKNELSKQFLENYAVASFKSVVRLSKQLSLKLNIKKQREYKSKINRSDLSLIKDLDTESIQISDLTNYISYLRQNYLEKKLFTIQCPQSMKDYNECITRCQTEYFPEDSNLYWEVRVSLLTIFSKQIQSHY